MSTRRQDRTIVGVLEVSCSSRCFFGFVTKPSAFVMSFDCLLLSDVVRSFVPLSSVKCIRTVRFSLSLSLSVVDNQRSFLSTRTSDSSTIIAKHHAAEENPWYFKYTSWSNRWKEERY
jgi:hypothetical protein